MNLYSISVPTYQQAIRNFLSILEKVPAWMAQKNLTDAVVLQSRLAIDMLPLVRQVQILSDNARFAVAALTGTAPVSFDDKGVTVLELCDRLKRTLECLDSFTEADFEEADLRKVELKYFPGQYMTGSDYLTHYGLPNFFFHLVTAYDILRHHGLEIGKKDYLGGLPLKQL